ncbi:hypothetical protein HMPREF9072_00952 [Capnocytophaga sp. oral taxon 324 str. F0483]|nr:hypothetical protein HMPREF9072_00952 [Capnocytophaga sp. oral taxon 324 str. F0483]
MAKVVLRLLPMLFVQYLLSFIHIPSCEPRWLYLLPFTFYLLPFT